MTLIKLRVYKNWKQWNFGDCNACTLADLYLRISESILHARNIITSGEVPPVTVTPSSTSLLIQWKLTSSNLAKKESPTDDQRLWPYSKLPLYLLARTTKMRRLDLWRFRYLTIGNEGNHQDLLQRRRRRNNTGDDARHSFNPKWLSVGLGAVGIWERKKRIGRGTPRPKVWFRLRNNEIHFGF